MNVQKIITKKSNNFELSKEEIYYMIEGINDYVSDYQMSSFLMAIKINGFSFDELFHYTSALVDSGEKNEVLENVFDKHSTGGIGDKTTLIIIPILMSLNIKMLKMSGKVLKRPKLKQKKNN